MLVLIYMILLSITLELRSFFGEAKKICLHGTCVGMTHETKRDLSLREESCISPMVEMNFPNRKTFSFCLSFILIILLLGSWEDLTSYCSNLVGRVRLHTFLVGF